MRSEVIPPVGTEVRVRRIRDTFRPAVVVGHLHDASLGDVLELRPSDSDAVFQRIWPSPTIELPPAA